MAQTTSQISSCDTTIKLDDENGILNDITGSSNSVSIERLQNVGDGLKTFGTDFPVRQACGRDANISLRVVYSQADNEALYILNDWYHNHKGTSRSFQVDVPDSNPGSDRYAFEVFLQSLRFDDEAGSADPIMVEVALRPTGTFTWTVVGS